jgi:hypothetical protein
MPLLAIEQITYKISLQVKTILKNSFDITLKVAPFLEY